MNKATLLTLPCLFGALLTPVLSPGEDFFLYTPKPAAGDQVPASPDQGVLVRKITVKRGDTLANLSRKYIGRGSWFPQVLLFNNIKNPDLIYTGDKLLVPVPEKSATGKRVQSQKKHAKGEKRHGARRRAAARHKGISKTKTAGPVSSKPENAKPVTAKQVTARSQGTRALPVTASEQVRYQQAKIAYLKGDYQKALDLFTDFRREFPGSKFSADVALYQADCLLHLSGE